jgi:hypothetical protein
MKRLGMLALVVALVAIAFTLYRSRETDRDRIVVQLVPGPPQPKVSAAEAGLDPAAIQLAVDYAGKRRTAALVIGRNGHLVFEKYWGDTTLETSASPDHFATVLAPLLVGSAMNDRLITNLDEPVSNYLAQFTGTPSGAATLRELLGGKVAGDVNPTELIALVLEGITRQPYESLVSERLWRPLGGGEVSFARNGAAGLRPNAATAGCCVSARIADWMRIGELLANDGVFEANQFTPPRFVTLMLKPAGKESVVGFGVNVSGQFAAGDVAWLGGSRNQRLWVVPSKRLVILRVGDEPAEADGWDEAMIPDSIIRGTSGWKPRSAGEGVDPARFAPH